MEKNYIILAHTNPEQLNRLVNKLNDGSSWFFIHVDLKSDFKHFEFLNTIPQVRLINERINCMWGDYSTITATLMLIENVLRERKSGITILISGQDYPLKSNADIDRYFSKAVDCNFISVGPVEEIWKEPIYRTKYYKFNLSGNKRDFAYFISLWKMSVADYKRLLYLILTGKFKFSYFFKLFNERKTKLFKKLYGGYQWWALNFDTLLKMKMFIDVNFAELEQYYEYSLLPDEMYFQTILMHLKNSDPSIQIEPNILYQRWEGKEKFSPVVFTTENIEELITAAPNKLIARKFDTNTDAIVLDLIDKHIKEEQNHHG